MSFLEKKGCVCYHSKIITFIFQKKAVFTSNSIWDNQHFESRLHTLKSGKFDLISISLSLAVEMLKRNLSSSTSSLYCTSQQWMPSLQWTRNREMNNPLLRKGSRKWMRKPCKVWTSCFKQLSILLGKKGHLLISPIC